MGKLFTFRKPKLKVTKKGIKVTSPSARIGGKSGINLSKTGVSASLRTPLGTANTGKFNPLKASKKNKSGCFGILIFIFLIIFIISTLLI
jgi:hypothetical protein